MVSYNVSCWAQLVSVFLRVVEFWQMVIYRLLDGLKRQMSKACIDRSDSLIFQHKRRPWVTKYKKIYFGFTYASCEVHFRSTESQTFFWSIMTADDSIKIMLVRKLRHNGPSGRFLKSLGLSASVSFLSSLPPSPLFQLRHFSRGLWFSFLVLCSKTARKRLLHRLEFMRKGIYLKLFNLSGLNVQRVLILLYKVFVHWKLLNFLVDLVSLPWS